MTKRSWNYALVAAMFAYFALRLVFFAVSIDPTVPPDESTHVGISQVYQGSLFRPSETESSFEFGVVSRIPYVYYFVMGRLLNVTAWIPVSQLVVLRLANVCFGLLTVVYAFRWIRLLTSDTLVQILFLCLITNTLMFSFLSSAVSYDNLTNLLAAVSFFHLLRFLQSEKVGDLAACVCTVLLGNLTKVTFLPIAAAVFPLIAIQIWRSSRLGVRSLADQLAQQKRSIGWLAGAALFLLALNGELYGTNFIKYGRLVPVPNQVMEVEQARRNRIFARSYVVRAYRSGRMTFEQATAAAMEIEHAQDRQDTLDLLEITRSRQDGIEEQVAFSRYARQWVGVMLRTTYGILGHKSMFAGNPVLRTYWRLIYASLILLAISQIRQAFGAETDKPNIFPVVWLTIWGLYVAAVFWNSYRTFDQTGIFVLAVQGRYLFPVLIPLYGLTAYGGLCMFPRWLQRIVVVLVAGLFVYGDFPFFLRHATTDWFFPS